MITEGDAKDFMRYGRCRGCAHFTGELKPLIDTQRTRLYDVGCRRSNTGQGFMIANPDDMEECWNYERKIQFL